MDASIIETHLRNRVAAIEVRHCGAQRGNVHLQLTYNFSIDTFPPPPSHVRRMAAFGHPKVEAKSLGWTSQRATQ